MFKITNQFSCIEHSEVLAANCRGPTNLVMPTEMDHNTFSFCDDLLKPLK